MSENNRASVYVHINLVNNKKYFGITTQEPEKRWQNGNGYYRNAHFMNAIKKYGWDNFGHFVLYENIPIKIAKNIEEMLIREHMSYDPRFGYNKTMGGELEIPTEEARKKMSESMNGHEVLEETRRKISESLSGREVLEETRRKISESLSGHEVLEETRRKISESLSERLKNNPELLHNPPKQVEAIDPESGQRVLYFESTRDAGRAGFKQGNISKCCNGKRKTHHGLAWRFFKEVNDGDSDN